jgi:hypothetical protein
MNTAVATFARISLLLCAGFAGSALAPPLPKSEQTVQTEADRNEQAELKQSSRASSTPSDPAAVQAVAGDWELRLGTSSKPMAVLRLRPARWKALSNSRSGRNRRA